MASEAPANGKLLRPVLLPFSPFSDWLLQAIMPGPSQHVLRWMNSRSSSDSAGWRMAQIQLHFVHEPACSRSSFLLKAAALQERRKNGRMTQAKHWSGAIQCQPFITFRHLTPDDSLLDLKPYRFWDNATFLIPCPSFFFVLPSTGLCIKLQVDEQSLWRAMGLRINQLAP